MDHPFDRLIRAVQDRGVAVAVRGDRARCLCPAHADRRPSLSITKRPDRVLVKCHGGCSTGRVLARLGWRLPELFLTPRQRQPREIVDTYEYEDISGKVIARKVRFQPKAFRWQVPDGKDPDGEVIRWKWGGAQVGLYRLAHLIDQRRIVLVEGEKAVKLLEQSGIAATCPPAGASVWRDEWAHDLWRVGADEVVILPDGDRTGIAHAERIARSCCTEGIPDTPGQLITKIVVLDGLPSAGDVVDWLQIHSVKELRDRIEQASVWTPESAATAKLARRRERGKERSRRFRAKAKQSAVQDVA